MKTVSVYCSFRDGWYWHAQCDVDGVLYESKRKIHNSARQAADEVLGHVQADYQVVTMRRLAPKVYEIEIPDDSDFAA